jgi:hypothetical protein
VKNSNATPLIISALAQMEQQGFNRNALLLMQQNLISMAVRVSEPNTPSEKLIDLATSFSSEKTYLAYSQALVEKNRHSVRELETVARHLQWIEKHLERQYAISLAKDIPLSKFAQQQGAITNVYAGLIDACRDLEKSGVVPVSNSKTLAAISEKSDGPLGEIHQKALAVLDAQEQSSRSLQKMAA